MKATIFHNPKCSKSRCSLALLQEHDLELEEIRYLDSPPSKMLLSELCDLMGVKPIEIVRTGESLFKELGLKANDQKTDEQWLEILAQNPKLIERPIVRIGNQAVMGRPPENILKILPVI